MIIFLIADNELLHRILRRAAARKPAFAPR
jgi:hypothetical protein